MKEKFYFCPHCGNLVGMIHSSGAKIVCCREEMRALVPNTTEAAGEKHLPVVTVLGNTVKVDVGSVTHPMQSAHFIEWIYLATTKGGHRAALTPDAAPTAVFNLAEGEEPIAAYSYCNLHGLWSTNI